MKSKIIFMLILNICLCCCSIMNKKKIAYKEKKMKKFDLKDFNKYKNENLRTLKIDSITTVELFEYEHIYMEKETKLRSPFETRYEYYKNTLSLKTESQVFYSMLTGIFKEYDEKGNVIKEINYDQVCNTSINELIELVKNYAGIDLSQKIDGVSVYRIQKNLPEKSEYRIIYKTNPNSYREILIDCNTGKIKSDILGNFIE